MVIAAATTRTLTSSNVFNTGEIPPVRPSPKRVNLRSGFANYEGTQKLPDSVGLQGLVREGGKHTDNLIKKMHTSINAVAAGGEIPIHSQSSRSAPWDKIYHGLRRAGVLLTAGWLVATAGMYIQEAISNLGTTVISGPLSVFYTCAILVSAPILTYTGVSSYRSVWDANNTKARLQKQVHAFSASLTGGVATYESMTAMQNYMEGFNGYITVIKTNAFGEFWPEIFMYLALIPVAGYLCKSVIEELLDKKGMTGRMEGTRPSA